jgi:phosphate transport system permease protein
VENNENEIVQEETNEIASVQEEKPDNGFKFSEDSLKRKFRISEFLSKYIITGVAFLNITIIVLIFVFVFKESLPIFSSKQIENTEVYGEEGPERYGETTDDQTLQQPERYTGEEEEEEEEEVESGPERYGIEEDTQMTAEQFAQDSILSGKGNEAEVGSDEATFKSLTGKKWYPVSDHPRYGLVPLFVGTLKITLIGILFAAPLAILAALFSAAFAPKWLREWVKPAIELLASFPSVVIGFFALMVMATFFQDVFGYDTRLNAFVGGVAMALAAIPIIFTVSEDALTSVPSSYTEASLALGASKWQTAFFVTLPSAVPGIFAAVLLGIGRIFGETMIALMATGNAAMISMNPFDSVRTLSATIGAEMAEVVFGDTHYNVLFLIGALLFIFTFTLNAIAEFYVKGKLMKKLQGK